MKKKLGLIFLCVMLFLTGCSALNAASVYDDEGKIASQTNTYSKVNYKASERENTFALTCEVFEGMDTIWTYKAEDDVEMCMLYTLKVESGKAKLVLILPDGSLETIVEVTSESEDAEAVETTLQLKEGVNRIKLVGDEDTSVELEMAIQEEESI